MHRHDPAYIIDLAARVMGDAKAAAEWLARPRLQLGGRAPRELLATEDGARRVEELLGQIDDEGYPTRRPCSEGECIWIVFMAR
jgi:putative toxin-antitoxin system antitoxin component (TIGR02293 family)